MGYTIDVYRRQMEPSESFIEFGGFLAFFPHLVAGPIQRSSGLLLQFREPRPPVTRDDVREALWLIAWGLYKKMVVADNMGLIANGIFGPYDKVTGPMSVPNDGLRLLVGLYAFAFQIYGDFSGYSDIARGTAKLLGFDIMINFNLPYFATSPSSFWRRWHISLSTWLRDYLYIGLGGNRGGAIKTYRNLFLTMLLGGLWHGAAWTFVLWGAYHGILLIVYRLLGLRTEEKDNPWYVNVMLGLVMFHLTCIGWLLFRAKNLATVGVFLQAIFLHPHSSPEAAQLFHSFVFYAWFLVFFQVIQGTMGTLSPMRRLPWFALLNIWAFILMSLASLSVQTSQEFIYFDF
jgi:D-alanyl-lipoteichoic acid acyltransferase DltB (MBOAT superfamily)